MSAGSQQPQPTESIRLDRERILDVAMRIVDQEGMDALSMRRLGKELRVDPMAVYYHLPNKQAIITGLVQRVFEEILASLQNTDKDRWQARVRNWAMTYRDVARRHANLVVHLVNHADAATESVLRMNEELYAALESAGLPPEEVVGSADMIADYIHGVILAEGIQTSDDTEWRAIFLDRFEGSSGDELASMRRVFAMLDPEDLKLNVEFALDVMITGLEQRSPSE